MSSIVTFYSYKGGVGRSMALANIAVELSRRDKKVLMVDWDLEAPGLERYFANFTFDTSKDGLLQLLIAYHNQKLPNYHDFIWEINTGYGRNLHLMHSGRDKDPVKYSHDLENFDWGYFFEEQQGGYHLEELRNKWLLDYDIVLVDSRTGLSDASGICTILLPDIILPMFTANYQSLFGISDIMSYIQASRQKLSVDRMALTILPVPSRFGTRVEFKESQEWLDRIGDILKECYSDWLPKWISPRYILEQVKIPQVDYFSFGEKLAVVEQGVSDPEGMGFIYSKLADLLASDLKDIETFVGASYFREKKDAYYKDQPAKTPATNFQNKSVTNFEYDLYISYPRIAYQWVRELLLPALNEYLSDELGYTPKIFFDVNDIVVGNLGFSKLQDSIEKSKLLVFVYSETDKSSSMERELMLFESRQRASEANIIFPVLFSKTKKNSEWEFRLREQQVTDLSDFSINETFRSTKIRSLFAAVIEKLCRAIANNLALIGQDGATTKAGFIDDRLLLIEIGLLADEYEYLRKTMPGGNKRTELMTNIFARMKALHVKAGHLLSQLMDSFSAGKRLVAIAFLQEGPDIAHIDWLTEHVGGAEKPFVGYQATVAIYLASRAFGQSHHEYLLRATENAINNINKATFRDPNQVAVLNTTLTQLKIN